MPDTPAPRTGSHRPEKTETLPGYRFCEACGRLIAGLEGATPVAVEPCPAAPREER